MSVGKLFIIAVLVLLPDDIFADSPLTSTPFHEKYTDIDIVLKAGQTGVMNIEFAEYLHNKSNPIDVKAALINALGWNFDGKQNASIYSKLIFKKEIMISDVPATDANDLFVIGYLMAMDDYFNVSGALPYLKKARQKYKKSYTVSIIEALVKAQNAMDKDFCKSWKYVNKVFSNDGLKMDMREDARKVIFDYMILYKGDCK